MILSRTDYTPPLPSPRRSYETCVDPGAPDFNPCVDHYRAAPHNMGTTSSETAEEEEEEEEVSSAESGAFECVAEARYPLPAGTVCDHDDYK